MTKKRKTYIYPLPEMQVVSKECATITWDADMYKQFEDFYYSKDPVPAGFLSKFYHSGYWREEMDKLPVQDRDSGAVYAKFLLKERLNEFQQFLKRGQNET